MASFTIKRQISAPPERVFDLLTDHRGYTELTPVRKVEMEREGSPDPNGVGAIRVLTLVGPPLREEVIEFERPTKFAYKLLSGLPVRDHVGTVRLEAADGGTLMVYDIDTTPTIPVVGGAVVPALRLSVGRLVAGLAKAAEATPTPV
jgi:uncharacterized protein YndB with AHSA1/START domain